jgi:hypothetical protein
MLLEMGGSNLQLQGNEHCKGNYVLGLHPLLVATCSEAKLVRSS